MSSTLNIIDRVNPKVCVGGQAATGKELGILSDGTSMVELVRYKLKAKIWQQIEAVVDCNHSK